MRIGRLGKFWPNAAPAATVIAAAAIAAKSLVFMSLSFCGLRPAFIGTYRAVGISLCGAFLESRKIRFPLFKKCTHPFTLIFARGHGRHHIQRVGVGVR